MHRSLTVVISFALAAALVTTLAGCPDRGTARAGKGSSGSSSAAGKLPQRVKLTLLTINDFHGQLDTLERRTLEKPPRSFRIGGAEALAATVAELRAADPDGTLLLDGGDFMQGSLLSNHFEGAPVRALFKLIGVAASAVGNHEFDFGAVGAARTGDLRGALKAFAKGAPYPLLTANIKAPDWPWPNIQRSTIIKRRGVRIGLIGLTTTDTPATTLKVAVDDLKFLDLANSVKREIDALRERGADIIVALGHIGGHCKPAGPTPDDKTKQRCTGEMFRMLDKLPEGTIDALVAGHAHRCIYTRYRGTLVSEACSRGVAVGRIKLVLERRSDKDKTMPAVSRARYRVVASESRVLAPQPVCHDIFSDTKSCEGLMRTGKPKGKVVENPLLARRAKLRAAVQAIIARYRKAILRVEQRRLTKLTRGLPHNYGGYSPLGTLFAAAIRKAVRGAHVGLMNGGGVRGSLGTGELRYRDLYRVFPFDNRIAWAKLTGAELIQILEDSVARQHGGLMQVAGIRVKVDCGPPRKLVHVHDLKGKPLDPKKHYVVAMSDFMLNGGDGLGPVISKVPAKRKHIGTRTIRDVLARYFAKRGRSYYHQHPKPSPLTIHGSGKCGGRRPRRTRHVCR